MPLYLNRTITNSAQLMVWKITEPIGELRAEVVCNEKNQLRLCGMKSELHQRAFLSVRKLLAQAGYSDFDLYYDEFGKPHLHDGKHISISHSHEFAAIIISSQTVGIDLEMAREKIIRIAHKFASVELPAINQANTEDYINKLTVIWGVKESIFKIRNEPGISFNNHISVSPFELSDKTAVGTLRFGMVTAHFDIHFEAIEDFMLVYAFEAQTATDFVL